MIDATDAKLAGLVITAVALMVWLVRLMASRQDKATGQLIEELKSARQEERSERIADREEKSRHADAVLEMANKVGDLGVEIHKFSATVSERIDVLADKSAKVCRHPRRSPSRSKKVT